MIHSDTCVCVSRLICVYSMSMSSSIRNCVAERLAINFLFRWTTWCVDVTPWLYPSLSHYYNLSSSSNGCDEMGQSSMWISSYNVLIAFRPATTNRYCHVIQHLCACETTAGRENETTTMVTVIKHDKLIWRHESYIVQRTSPIITQITEITCSDRPQPQSTHSNHFN